MKNHEMESTAKCVFIVFTSMTSPIALLEEILLCKFSKMVSTEYVVARTFDWTLTKWAFWYDKAEKVVLSSEESLFSGLRFPHYLFRRQGTTLLN